eukprot:8567425-Pyramimonas_sp.AAC.1
MFRAHAVGNDASPGLFLGGSRVAGGSFFGPWEGQLLTPLTRIVAPEGGTSIGRCLPSRRFASDALWGPQDGPKMAQEGHKRAQDAPKTAPRTPKSAPRGLQKRPK